MRKRIELRFCAEMVRVEICASAKPKHFFEMREFGPSATTKKSSTANAVLDFFGGDGEDRTPDLTDANRTLSQLSYAPKQFPMRCRIGSIVSLSYLLWFVKW